CQTRATHRPKRAAGWPAPRPSLRSREPRKYQRGCRRWRRPGWRGKKWGNGWAWSGGVLDLRLLPGVTREQAQNWTTIGRALFLQCSLERLFLGFVVLFGLFRAEGDLQAEIALKFRWALHGMAGGKKDVVGIRKIPGSTGVEYRG